MATRHNACVNPACSVNVSGWGGGSTPTRVTGLTGYNRTTGARYTSGGYLTTPAGVAASGDQVTISLDLLTEVFDDAIVDLYFYVTRSTGGDTQVGAVSTIGLTAGVVSRVSLTRTCPANTTGAFLVVDGINMTISPAVGTAVLNEIAASAGAYFDGDSPGATWDGTTGLSASTLTDSNDGAVAATLPLPTSALTGDSQDDAALAAMLPTLSLAVTGDSLDDAAIAGLLPMPTAALTADVITEGSFAALLPEPTAVLTADSITDGALAGAFPPLTAQLFEEQGEGRGPRDIASTAYGRDTALTPAGRAA